MKILSLLIFIFITGCASQKYQLNIESNPPMADLYLYSEVQKKFIKLALQISKEVDSLNISFVKKMYGKQLLSDIINEMLQEGLANFFQNDDSNYVGQPITNKNSPTINWSVKDMQDFEFIFDVGMSPDFEIQGMGDGDSFEKYVIDIPEDIESIIFANSGFAGVTSEVREGDKMGTLYGYKWRYENGERYIGSDGKPRVNLDERVKVGNAFPDFISSINKVFIYRKCLDANQSYYQLILAKHVLIY